MKNGVRVAACWKSLTKDIRESSRDFLPAGSSLGGCKSTKTEMPYQSCILYGVVVTGRSRREVWSAVPRRIASDPNTPYSEQDWYPVNTRSEKTFTIFATSCSIVMCRGKTQKSIGMGVTRDADLYRRSAFTPSVCLHVLNRGTVLPAVYSFLNSRV